MTRRGLWSHLIQRIDDYISRVDRVRVTPELDPAKLRGMLAPMDFSQPLSPNEAVDFVIDGLWRHQVHTPHAMYFGLFNPAPTTMGIAADTAAAAFNPQLAAWSHSPFAVEIEQHLIRAFSVRFGYDPVDSDGTFAGGGAEANHTALLTALVHRFPEFARQGVRGLRRQPLLYVSTQSHHSFLKAARLCGLGTDAVREVPINSKLQMNVESLTRMIEMDRREGLRPFLVVGTAGTTSAGVIDLLSAIADVAEGERMWFHTDAAWGGAAAFLPELHGVLDGIERSDSITFDAHKWLSVPMGAGIYLTRHRDILNRTFRVTTDYMPRDASELDVIDPYAHSIQWSRRFIGLKVFLSLLVAGWDGYARAIGHQVEMGDLLRRKLEAAGWKLVSETKLPVVCFNGSGGTEETSGPFVDSVAREVVSSGKAWISSTRLSENLPALRACITNYRTEESDLDGLIEALGEARSRVRRLGLFRRTSRDI